MRVVMWAAVLLSGLVAFETRAKAYVPFLDYKVVAEARPTSVTKNIFVLNGPQYPEHIITSNNPSDLLFSKAMFRFLGSPTCDHIRENVASRTYGSSSHAVVYGIWMPLFPEWGRVGCPTNVGSDISGWGLSCVRDGNCCDDPFLLNLGPEIASGKIGASLRLADAAGFAKRESNEKDADNGSDQASDGEEQNAKRPRRHILLGFQIMLACCGVLGGFYGLREAFKPLGRSIFIDRAQAELYALISFATVVVGCVLALVSLLPLIF